MPVADAPQSGLSRRGFGLLLAGLSCFGASPLWAQSQAPDLGQGLLDAAANWPVPAGWSQRQLEQGFVLSNAGGGEEFHSIFYRPLPVADKIRSTLMLVDLKTDDMRAYLGAVTMTDQGFCILSLYPDKFVDLNCSANGQGQKIGEMANVLKLDGEDRIQVLDEGPVTIFTVNLQEIGRIENHPAQGGEFGFIAGGLGEFALNYFSVAHMSDAELRGEPAPQNGPVTGQASDLPPQVETVPAGGTTRGTAGSGPGGLVLGDYAPREGWEEHEIAGGLLTVNSGIQGDERSFPLALDPPQGGLRMTEVSVSIAPAGSGPQSLRAAAGLVWENPQQGQSCGLQVTAGGDALLLCFGADGRGMEVARLKGAALGAGPHRLSVLEEGESLIAFVNDTEVGALKAHPSIGGEMALIAWDRGEFSFTGIDAQVMMPAAGSAPPARPPEPQSSTSMGDGLTGPLPQFEGDAIRATAAYLGVTKSILMHEVGHALIGELGVPSTGPEEDAVDIYSALHLAEATVDASGQPEMEAIASEAATYAALLWYYSGKVEEQSGTDQASGWQDEHTGGLKRFRNMFCVIYGANPQRFSPLAAAVQFEERTLARCEEEFLKQSRAWRAILSPYTRISAEMPEGRLPEDAPGAMVEVTLMPSRRQIGEYMRLNHGAELIATAEAIGRHYALPRPLQVVFQDCDTINAWYAPDAGQVTMCYDIIEHFITLISDVETGSQGGFSSEEVQMAQTMPAPPVAGGQGGAMPSGAPAQAAIAPEELQDFGIPASTRLFGPPFRGPTPIENPKAGLLTTPEVKALLDRDLDAIVIDIRRGMGIESLPMAYQLSGAGRDGSLEDGFQSRLASALAELTGGQSDISIVVLGDDVEDRAAWNAALRIGQAGYLTYWYRGGIAAWKAAGLPLQPLQ